MHPDYSADYEIVYNPSSHMFDVYYRGELIDALLPCYSDGENSIQLHAAIAHANREAWSAVLAPLYAAAQIVRQRYPDAAYGRWSDYVALGSARPLTTAYAVIALPDGYAVHRVLNGVIGAHVESIRVESHRRIVSLHALAA